MKITIENTTKTVTLADRPGGPGIRARVWQGTTESGIPVFCLITRVMVPEGRPAEDYEQFENELFETRKGTTDPALMSIPTRMII